MSIFTLAIAFLITSNLCWFMDRTFQVPMQYSSYSIGLYFHHQSHLQLGIVFALALSLHLFWSYFSTCLQQHIGKLLTWGVHLSVSCLLPFRTVHGVLKARILKYFAIPFSSGPYFVRILHHDPSVLDTRVPWTARRSNQSILKEISLEYLLEVLMLKLKLQYFGHLIWKTDSFEKTLNAGKDWMWEEMEMTEDEMVGWYHWLNGHEFE